MMKELDLHKTKHEDVKRKVIRFVEDNWDSGDTLCIITGHSDDMKNLVGAVLDEYQLDWQVGDIFGYDSGVRIFQYHFGFENR